MKIAFFISALPAGGIERYLLRFLTYYQKEIEATVYCKSGKTGVLEKDYLKVGAKVETLRVGSFNPKHLKALKKEFEKENYDAIIDFTNNFAAFTLFIAKQAGIKKRIVWYRNAEVKFRKTPLRLLYNNILNKITRRTATNILSNSKTAFTNFYKGFDWQNDDRFEVIYNGIDINELLNSNSNLRGEFHIPNNAFVVGHVGRYNEQKNHQTILKVAMDLCRKHNDIYFMLIGQGVDLALKDKVEQESLQQQIILTGNRSDIPNILATLNCFYFPSTIEGNPNALIEAMIVGLPIVASNIDPIKEATPEHMHEYLISPFDDQIAKEQILAIRNDSGFKYKMIHTDWAKKQFEAKKQFGEFFEKL